MTDRTTRARISEGIAIMRSTIRERSWSIQPPRVAAVKPRIDPSVKLRIVAMVAI